MVLAELSPKVNSIGLNINAGLDVSNEGYFKQACKLRHQQNHKEIKLILFSEKERFSLDVWKKIEDAADAEGVAIGEVEFKKMGPTDELLVRLNRVQEGKTWICQSGNAFVHGSLQETYKLGFGEPLTNENILDRLSCLPASPLRELTLLNGSKDSLPLSDAVLEWVKKNTPNKIVFINCSFNLHQIRCLNEHEDMIYFHKMVDHQTLIKTRRPKQNEVVLSRALLGGYESRRSHLEVSVNKAQACKDPHVILEIDKAEDIDDKLLQTLGIINPSTLLISLTAQAPLQAGEEIQAKLAKILPNAKFSIETEV